MFYVGQVVSHRSFIVIILSIDECDIKIFNPTTNETSIVHKRELSLWVRTDKNTWIWNYQNYVIKIERHDTYWIASYLTEVHVFTIGALGNVKVKVLKDFRDKIAAIASAANDCLDSMVNARS